MTTVKQAIHFTADYADDSYENLNFTAAGRQSNWGQRIHTEALVRPWPDPDVKDGGRPSASGRQ